MWPATGVVGATKVTCLPPEGGEDGGDEGPGSSPDELAGSTLERSDDAREIDVDVDVDEEDGSLSELMEEEAAVDGTATPWAVTTNSPPEFADPEGLESDPNLGDPVVVLFAVLRRCHSALHIQREMCICDQKAMTSFFLVNV